MRAEVDRGDLAISSDIVDACDLSGGRLAAARSRTQERGAARSSAGRRLRPSAQLLELRSESEERGRAARAAVRGRAGPSSCSVCSPEARHAGERVQLRLEGEKQGGAALSGGRVAAPARSSEVRRRGPEGSPPGTDRRQRSATNAAAASSADARLQPAAAGDGSRSSVPDGCQPVPDPTGQRRMSPVSDRRRGPAPDGAWHRGLRRRAHSEGKGRSAAAKVVKRTCRSAPPLAHRHARCLRSAEPRLAHR